MVEIKLGKYRHYKGNFYEVIGIAKHSETLEELVVYKSLGEYDGFAVGSLWVRPAMMFLSEVEIEGVGVPRFKYIDEDRYLYEE